MSGIIAFGIRCWSIEVRNRSLLSRIQCVHNTYCHNAESFLLVRSFFVTFITLCSFSVVKSSLC